MSQNDYMKHWDTAIQSNPRHHHIYGSKATCGEK